MNFRKTLIVTAVGTAMGGSAVTANAATITSITLGDTDQDGVISGFRFTNPGDASFPTGIPGTFPGDLTFGSTGELCGGSGGGTGNGGGAACSAIATGGTGGIGPNVFSTGFNFGGGGDFTPTISDTTAVPVTSGGVTGDVTATTLTFTQLDFAGIYNGAPFLLAPESRNENNNSNPWKFTVGTATVVDPAFHNWDGNINNNLAFQLLNLEDNGDGTFDFAINFTSRISSSNGDATNTSFDGFIARWRVEGCASTTGTDCVIQAVPVPAAVWLFGSGLLGLVGIARRKRKSA